MIIVPESHLDHALTPAQVEFIAARYADRAQFFIDTVELPEELGTVPCALYGPAMGDAPVPDAIWHACGHCASCQFYGSGTLCGSKSNANGGAVHRKRGARAYTSRVVERAPRPTRLVTVIAGPHGDASCVLYTAFGGPLAPKEPGDPTLRPDEADASAAFWAAHALAEVQS